jgi:hypothetical protein
MNASQIRTLLGIVACVVVYTGATSAGKHISTGNADREAFAHSLDNEDAGILFNAIGPQSRTLRITLEPDRRDPAGCDSVRMTLFVEQGFLRDAYYNHGFRSIECLAIAPDRTIETLEDEIVPPAPAPFVSPVPRVVPNKHDARVTDTRA